MSKAHKLVQAISEDLPYSDFQICTIYMNVTGEKKSCSLHIVNCGNNKNISKDPLKYVEENNLKSCFKMSVTKKQKSFILV